MLNIEEMISKVLLIIYSNKYSIGVFGYGFWIVCKTNCVNIMSAMTYSDTESGIGIKS